MSRALKPSTPFARRLVDARTRKFARREEFSALLDVPVTTLGNWERGRTFPPPDALAKMAGTLGVTLDWLLTGSAPQPMPESQPMAVSPLQLDPYLMGLIVDGITNTYKTASASLPPRHLGQLAARLASDLMAAYTDPAEQAIGLRILLEQLKRDIQNDETASGKRSA